MEQFMIHTDSFFCIGKTHTICQDYTEHGKDHIVVSDGCSGSPESNIGSLLMCRAAKLFIGKHPYIDHSAFCNNVIAGAYTYAKALELHEDSLNATLLSVVADEKAFRCTIAGDGVIATRVKHKPNLWHIYEYVFPSGAPYYLRYTLDPKINDAYVKEFGTKFTVCHYCLNLNDPNCPTVGAIRPQAFGSVFSTEFYDICDAVAIFSDGVSSFQQSATTPTSKTTTPVPLIKILSELLNFKNYNGSFVQRRCKAAFQKFTKDNWVNTDDFSMSVIYREEKPAIIDS